MREFLQSPSFLLVVTAVVFVFVVIVLLWKNIHWEPRHVTPTDQVAERQMGILERMKNLFPRSAVAWSVIGAVVLIALVAWGLSGTHGTLSQSLSAPSPSTVARGAQNHWLWILIIGSVTYVLLSFIPKDKEALAKKLQWLLGVTMVLLLVGLPAWFAARDAFLPQIICKDVSAHETRSCNLNTAWSTWIKAAEGPAVDGMRMCASPGGQSERREENGTTFFRFKADEGRLIKAYRLVPGNQKCPVAFPS